MAEKLDKTSYPQQKNYERALPQLLRLRAVAATGAAIEEGTPTLTPAKTGKNYIPAYKLLHLPVGYCTSTYQCSQLKSADSWVSQHCPVGQNWVNSSKNLFLTPNSRAKATAAAAAKAETGENLKVRKEKLALTS